MTTTWRCVVERKETKRRKEKKRRRGEEVEGSW